VPENTNYLQNIVPFGFLWRLLIINKTSLIVLFIIRLMFYSAQHSSLNRKETFDLRKIGYFSWF